MRRHFLIEKAKDAQIIGILIGTLGVKNYLDAIRHLRNLIKLAGRKSYTLAVGKLNVAKLANFQEIDLYVYVACPENTFFDSKDFYRPVITPYELEVALNPNREWGVQYFTDFNEILPGGSAFVPLPDNIREKEAEYDISLISGRIRKMGVEATVDDTADEATSLVKKEQTISVIHSGAAGEVLKERFWRGLDPSVGKTPVSKLTEGRSGIAMGYEEEGKE